MNQLKAVIRAASTLALVAGCAGGLQAQTTYSKNPDTTVNGQEMISKVNKASSLIGMDVRNAQNEKLGDIKDLVVDLHSGKIAYAVLSVGGFLGIGDKYIAVPPSAFTPTADDAGLVLNADKAKIQNAPGFAKSDWPALNDTSWRSQDAYWLSGNAAQGTVGSTRSGTQSAYGNSAWNGSSKEGHFRGQITAVDPSAKTMAVKGALGTREFNFVAQPSIHLQSNSTANLNDLKVGDSVNVEFHQENGKYLADSVMESK
jgi:sporulation protein YlmC with PRC-barrel domain/Cu/Ag efflux protein CusF